MKKLLIIISILILSLSLIGCEKNDNKLFILNVGDYINDELITMFEEEYDCEIVYTEVNSNEEIYQKLKNERYDICVVSDYMIDRMNKENLIYELDKNKVPEYYTNYQNDLFSDAYDLLYNNTDTASYKDSYIPYFWGTVGILYRTDVDGLEEYINQNQILSMFTNNIYKKGMYNSSRDALCMSIMAKYNNISNTMDINTTDTSILREAMKQIKDTEYIAWGDDNLKSMVQQGLLDMALVYSGDYLDEYYQCETDNEEVMFNYFIPEHTNIWFDGVVITKQAKNIDLAYDFLNFLSNKDVQAMNADYIGYCPMFETVYDILFDEEGDYQYDSESEMYKNFIPVKGSKLSYKYAGSKHYSMLNDLLDEAKSK